MESGIGIISQQNTVYVLNTSYKYGSADMMNFLLTPSAIKGENNKQTSTSIDATTTTMQTKLPQAVAEHGKETFNDKTRKSLLKINLFIKRLKWFNIFNDTQSSEKQTTTLKGQESSEAKQKCSKFLNTKKSLSTKEMYREAAKLLGIDCSLTSSCRCYDCQSHYFDYDDSTEHMEESDSECDEDSCSDTDSLSSELNEPEHYVTNCYLIHTEELCECCQMQNERNQHQQHRCPPRTTSYTDIACNDLSFNTFLS